METTLSFRAIASEYWCHKPLPKHRGIVVQEVISILSAQAEGKSTLVDVTGFAGVGYSCLFHTF
jgi:putative protein kinase ArgK-like GTPase of G3E family